MTHRVRNMCAWAAVCVALVGALTIRSRAFADATFQFNILSVRGSSGGDVVKPGDLAVVKFSVTNPQTGQAYDLRTDPAWTQTASGASRLFFQIAWNTVDITNTDSGSNAAGGRGAAMPIPVNALGPLVIANGDGTYEATAPLPVPPTAKGSGVVAMEGHPAGPDATGAFTVRVPVRSVYANFKITDTVARPRRQIVTIAKCQRCHRPDGTGRAPALVLHGSNRTEEPQVCVTCHNANNTDIVFRNATHPQAAISSYRYPEQSLDFKRMIHGIHASADGMRRNPLVIVGRNGALFDASTLANYPGELENCSTCHIDDGRQGTFELPLAPGVIGSSFATRSFNPDGTVTIDTDPNNDVKISPIASVCSSCHDDREAISHMVNRGGASFSTNLPALQSGQVQERCVSCHGRGRERSVRKEHDD